MRTQVQSPRIHVKLDVGAGIWDTSTPMGRCKAEMGESLDTHRPAGLAYAAGETIRDPHLTQGDS